jgi:serine/threonine protein phosphatase PrpC
LGDLHGHKVGISSDPETEVWEIEPNDVFVVIGSDGVWDVVSSAEAVGFISKYLIAILILFRNPEDPSQMARALANEARERWDLFNEINRTKKKLSLEGMDEVRKKSSLANFEQNIMRDDITVVIGYLQNIA